MSRFFRHRVGALAGVLLAGTVMLAWPSPASGEPTTGSQATFDGFVASCPAPPSAQSVGPATIGSATANQIQCAANTGSSGAQVTGVYSGGKFDLKCAIANGFVTTIKRVGSAPQELTAVPYTGQTVTVSAVVDGVPVSVSCGPAATAPTTTTAAPYPLAVDVGGASGADPALSTQAATSAQSSGSGATWLFVAGGAALLLGAGQLAIGRRIGRNNPATD